MRWNLYDQSHRVYYKNGGADYWQFPPTPDLLNICQPFVSHARDWLGKINSFGPTDYLVCVYVQGGQIHLIRAHNGGKDTFDRPQRSVFVVWSEPLKNECLISFARWVQDSTWPIKDPVSLPHLLCLSIPIKSPKT